VLDESNAIQPYSDRSRKIYGDAGPSRGTAAKEGSINRIHVYKIVHGRDEDVEIGQMRQMQ